MSFLSKFFGGGPKKPEPPKTQEYKGYVIAATPFMERERWQVAGSITLVIDGAERTESFIRADSTPSLDDAVEMTFFKARQIIDQRGPDLPR